MEHHSEQIEPCWLIVDDDHLVCKALRRLVGPEQPTVLAHSGAQARTALSRVTSWVGWFLDFKLGDESGLDVLLYARERHPDVPAALLTGEEPSHEMINRTFSLGAGFLSKPVAAADVDAFIARCLARRHGAGQQVAAVVESLARNCRLAPRELELIVRVVTGATIEEAQRQMGISRSTRKTYTSNLLAKLQAKDLNDVTRRVLRAALGRRDAGSP